MKKVIALGIASVASALVLAPTANAAPYNEATVNKFIDIVNMEAAKYGLAHVPVYVAPLPGDIIAQTQFGAITLDASYAALTPEQFDYEMSDEFASGHTPTGCNGIAAVAVHEFAHVIDQRQGLITRMIVEEAVDSGRLSGQLHNYAFDSSGNVLPGEAVAVSFQAVECGSATPAEQTIYNVLVS